ncbi:hypothetical protein AB0L35_05195 [Streptomyces sp. NPDC052309]|uniref:hypothetical protein n=1 Tax=Streptomyces sp. NPDC052309 TaxID=3155421 RepID=UPI0034332373
MPENQSPDPFEGRLTAALRDTGDRFDTDRAALVAGGQTRGRRARMRRRAGVLGGAAGIALVGVGGALLLPAEDSSGPERSSVASSTTARPSASSSPAPFSDDDLLRELKKRLPEGEFSEEGARGTADELGAFAHLVYDDGKGAAAIGISFARVEPGSQQIRELTECPDRTFVEYDDCSTSRLPDGSLLKLYQGYEYPDRRVDTKFWSADLVTSKGQHVTLSEWNSPAQKDAPITRPNPPLSTAQLKEVVTAEVWRRVVDALPENPKQPTKKPAADPVPPGVSGKKIGETLTALLPQKLDVVKQGGQDTEYAYVVVDDGKGQSLVQINVQHGMSDVADQLYGNGQTLPDGTRVATRQGNGDDRVAGVVMWTVDTMRPGSDGFRVVVSAFNNGAAHAEPGRATPALTMEQLKEIALSPKWDQLAK